MGETLMKKIFILLIYLILPCALFITSSYAADTESEEYIVKEHDTLWDISDMELEDTFLWPKLWSVNPHIENPDLIYPGSKIIIPSREELMRMPTPPKKLPFLSTPSLKKMREPTNTFVAREKRLQKYIVNQSLLISSGWISDEFQGVGKTSYYPMDRELAAKNDTVYLNIDKEADSETSFFTVRKVKVVKHPITGKTVGTHFRITGTVKVVGMDNNMPKAIVTSSFEDITLGEALLPFREIEPPLIPAEPRTPDINGYLIETHHSNKLASEGDIVFLDKGKDDGLEAGDIFSVISDSPARNSLAKIQVVSLQSTTAGALVLEATKEISVGSEWE